MIRVKDLIGSEIWLNRVIKGNEDAVETEKGERDADLDKPAESFHPKRRRANKMTNHPY